MLDTRITPEGIHVGLVHVAAHHPFHELKPFHPLREPALGVVLRHPGHAQPEDVQLALPPYFRYFFLRTPHTAVHRVRWWRARVASFRFVPKSASDSRVRPRKKRNVPVTILTPHDTKNTEPRDSKQYQLKK